MEYISKQDWKLDETVMPEDMNRIEGGISEVNNALNTEITDRQTADSTLQTAINGKANISHGHDTSNIVSGVLPVARGGTGVASMVGADYTAERPRAISLQPTTPGAINNGCIVGVYK